MEFTADADHQGDRLDRFLAGEIADHSRSQIQRLIESGHVTHSRFKKAKPNSEIREGDVITVDLPDAQPRTCARKTFRSRSFRRRRPGGGQQAGRHGGASRRRQPERHARECPAAPHQGPERHRRRETAGHRPSPRQGHVGGDGGREERRGPPGAVWSRRSSSEHTSLPTGSAGSSIATTSPSHRTSPDHALGTFYEGEPREGAAPTETPSSRRPDLRRAPPEPSPRSVGALQHVL